MYDPKNEAHEFTDVGRVEAIAMACDFYGLEAELVLTEHIVVQRVVDLRRDTLVL